MTPEQKQKIKELGLKVKGIVVDFTGSVTYHLSKNIDDVKIEVKDSFVASPKDNLNNRPERN